MSDERIIYIDPEDDLTSLRERLEQMPSRQVTLVVPATTQLRSQVAWQLLYKRARELGKEVLIVSSDPQIRSVAHAGKFRVATSLEASATSAKSRPPSRPARTNPSRVRYPGSSRALPRREAPGPASAGSRPLSDVPAGQQPASPPETRRSRPLPDASRMEEAELLRREPEQYESPAYDFHIDTTPPIHPVSSKQFEDEEPDLLAEDYHMSRGIREAASRSNPPPPQQEPMQPQQKPLRPSGTLNRSKQQPRPPSGKLARPRYLSEPLAPEKDDPFARPFLFADEQSAKGAAEALEGYIGRRTDAFTGYAPDQAAILQRSLAVSRGNYAALLICGDADRAKSDFLACFGSAPPGLPDSHCRNSHGRWRCPCGHLSARLGRYGWRNRNNIGQCKNLIDRAI